ncbi:MAG: TatD family hydrolase, partial [Nocardioidaceae bacterium]
MTPSQPMRSRVNAEFGSNRDVSRPPLPEPLPSPVVDNHCHLDIEDGESWLDPAEALALSGSVGVPRIVQIGCDPPGAAWAVQTATSYDGIVAGVALHPNEAPKLDAQGVLDEGIAEIERLVMSSPRVRAVGETGLDYYRTGPDGVAAQQRSFAAHIELAHRHDKTLVIHDREAHDDVLAMLDEHGVPERTV